MTSMTNLVSMTGDAAIARLTSLWATDGGPEVGAAALSVIGQAEGKGRVSPEVAQAARIAFAGWPGMLPGAAPEDLAPEDLATWQAEDLRARMLSAVKGAQLALRRAEACEVRDRSAARGVNVSLEDLLEAGEDFAEAGEASGPTSLRRAMPYGAPDRATVTDRGNVLALAMLAAQGAGVPAEVLSAVACPAESRKGNGDGGGVNVTATLRALGWRTAGKGRQTDGAALEACLSVMRAEGAGILSALAMRPGPARPLPATAVARMTIRAGGVRALPASAPRMVRADRPAPFMWQAEQERAVCDVPRGGRPSAVWQRHVTTGPVYGVTPEGIARTDLAGLRAYLTAKYAPAGTGEVCDRVTFMAPQADDDLAAGPMVSARPAPGVRPGTTYGPVGAIAGEGKALRPQASRRRKRDGGVGSPMI